MLIFFPVKADMLFSSILMSSGRLFLKFWDFALFNEMYTYFQSWMEVQVSILVSTRHQNWRKQHVSFHWKKINIVSFFVNFLAQSDSTGCFFGSTVDPTFFIKIANWMIFAFFKDLTYRKIKNRITYKEYILNYFFF